MHNRLILNSLVLGTVVLLSVGCSRNALMVQPQAQNSLNRIMNLTEAQIKVDSKALQQKIRQDALSETAMSLGARSGLAWRARQINQMLETVKSARLQ